MTGKQGLDASSVAALLEGTTPGPWAVKTMICVGGRAPCITYDQGNVGGQVASLALCENAEPNAALIAAVPSIARAYLALSERVAELEALLEIIDGGDVDVSDTAIIVGNGASAVKRQVRAALAHKEQS